MKPGSLIIQGANSRGYPKDEAIGKNLTSSFEEVFLMTYAYGDILCCRVSLLGGGCP
jgi:hypothetical protein